MSRGANWKEKDKEGETALHLSTRHRSSKCLSLLKSHLAPGEVDDQDNNKVSNCEHVLNVHSLELILVYSLQTTYEAAHFLTSKVGLQPDQRLHRLVMTS